MVTSPRALRGPWSLGISNRSWRGRTRCRRHWPCQTRAHQPPCLPTPWFSPSLLLILLVNSLRLAYLGLLGPLASYYCVLRFLSDLVAGRCLLLRFCFFGFLTITASCCSALRVSELVLNSEYLFTFLTILGGLKMCTIHKFFHGFEIFV